MCFGNAMVMYLDIRLYTNMSHYGRGAEVCFENATVIHIDIGLYTNRSHYDR